MYLQIPVKLERYVDEIKRQSMRHNVQKKITLQKIGKTKSQDSYKLMYIIYNPHPMTITVDPNFFNSNTALYKMYPTKFKVGANTAAAFVAFVSKEEDLQINESVIKRDLMQKIEYQILNSKYIKNDLEKYEASKILKIDPHQVDVEKTIDLISEQEKIHTDPQEYIAYSLADEPHIDITLQKLEIIERKVKLDMKISNNNSGKNIIFSGFRMKLYDDEQKMHIAINQEIRVKNNGYKKMSVFLNKIEFDQIELKKMQMSITIL